MLDGPIARGDACVLEFAGMFFRIDWKLAGRITSAKIGDDELLTDARVDALNYGSTFWTAPQADWHWPPVAEIDSAAYSVSADATSCTLVGPAVTSVSGVLHGIRLSKRFSADLERQAMVVDYTIENATSTKKRMAPWEITRVAPGGLTFFAADSAPMQAGTRPLLPTSSGAGAHWFKHDVSTPPDSKLNCDGKGWIAHVTPENALLIKSFPDIAQSQAAAGEAEIEIYAKSNATAAHSYVEVENQGAYAEVPAGGSLRWTVRWYLRKLPSALPATPGNAELLRFVTEALK
jgi:hypothetical protein